MAHGPRVSALSMHRKHDVPYRVARCASAVWWLRVEQDMMRSDWCLGIYMRGTVLSVYGVTSKVDIHRCW